MDAVGERVGDESVRDAIRGMQRAERLAWWAAHAGAPYLSRPSTVEDAIAASLDSVTDEAAPAPERLPEPDRIQHLALLAATLRPAPAGSD
jgi:hypothetical protein